MLPPLQTSATRLPASRSRRRSAPASARRARGLDEIARRLDHRHHRRADLIVGDEDEVVEVLAHDPLRQLERGARREALGERLHAILDRRPSFQLRYAAGAASDWTPMTSMPARTALPAMHAAAAPLPPPIGTTITSIYGSSSSISSVSSPRRR